MKTIYKVLYPLGYEEHQVEDGFPTALPFVDVKPLESLVDPRSQFFNFTENKWEEAVTQDYAKKLELLENLSAGLQVDNAVLKEANEKLTIKADTLAQINSSTMLAAVQNSKDIAAIQEQLNSVTEEGAE